MPGTYVRDASRPVLLNQNVTANVNGPAVEVSAPGKARVRLSIGNVSGTSPTMDVQIEGSQDGTTWLPIGRFPTKGASDANTERFLDVRPYTRYLRAVATVGGTSPQFNSVSISVEPSELRRTPTDRA